MLVLFPVWLRADPSAQAILRTIAFVVFAGGLMQLAMKHRKLRMSCLFLLLVAIVAATFVAYGQKHSTVSGGIQLRAHVGLFVGTVVMLALPVAASASWLAWVQRRGLINNPILLVATAILIACVAFPVAAVVGIYAMLLFGVGA